MNTPGQCLFKINHFYFPLYKSHNEHWKNWVSGWAMKPLQTADLHSNPLQKHTSQNKNESPNCEKQLQVSFIIIYIFFLLIS